MSKMILGMTFNDIVEKYSDMVTRICIMNLRNSDDAKDCYQNVFIKLFQKDIEFQNEEHLKAWLIRVCINECRNYIKRFYKFTIDIEQVIIADHQKNLTLLPEVLKLPKKYRNVLYLYYYEGYSIDEISHILQINQNTLKSQLKRGRELLRKKVGDFYE
jgi:RNA polymerase sigma factor (sigma-70 family)